MPGFWPSLSWPTWALVTLYWPIYGLVVTPACRIWTVGAEDRIWDVPAEDRVFEVICG